MNDHTLKRRTRKRGKHGNRYKTKKKKKTDKEERKCLKRSKERMKVKPKSNEEKWVVRFAFFFLFFFLRLSPYLLMLPLTGVFLSRLKAPLTVVLLLLFLCVTVGEENSVIVHLIYLIIIFYCVYMFSNRRC